MLLSYSYWQQKFGGASSVIGQPSRIDGKARQIIGVLPKGFHFLDYTDAALIVPFQWDRSKTKLGNFSERALARLKPGVTMEQASADMARLLPISFRSFAAPDGFSPALFDKASFSPNLRPLKQDVIGDVGKVLWVLMGSIAMVLLVACANVANLLLVRVEGRRQELAFAPLLARRVDEPHPISCRECRFRHSGRGHWTGTGLRRFAHTGGDSADRPSAHPRDRHRSSRPPFHRGPRTVYSLLIGAIPLQVRRRKFRQRTARRRPRIEPEPRTPSRAQDPCVVQVALALVLLICSGLMIRTFRAMMHVSPGFIRPESVETFRFYIPETQIPDSQADRVIRMDEGIQNKIAAIPGVSSVSFSTAVPMDGRNSMTSCSHKTMS